MSMKKREPIAFRKPRRPVKLPKLGRDVDDLDHDVLAAFLRGIELFDDPRATRNQKMYYLYRLSQELDKKVVAYLETEERLQSMRRRLADYQRADPRLNGSDLDAHGLARVRAAFARAARPNLSLTHRIEALRVAESMLGDLPAEQARQLAELEEQLAHAELAGTAGDGDEEA
ncbi:MAG: hypothetical protein D6705_14420 [Deltaproteobacteria bacterium]|nr:MAG: hypothetical protein D6705_14420 [Deltaproteobacteria bacterium]